MNKPAAILKSKFTGLNSVLHDSLWVKNNKNIGLLKQYREIWALRRNGLCPTDYFKYGLFEPGRFPDMKSKKTYGSYPLREEFRHYSDPAISAIAYHKHILYRLLETFDLPVPKIVALYAPRCDGFERHRSLLDREALKHFFLTTNEYPIFGKPSNASHGYGAMSFTGVTLDGQIILHDQTTVPVGDIVDQIHSYAMETGTYLLCEKLCPSPGLQALSGDALPSMRVITLLHDGKPEIFRAIILLPRIDSCTSNVRGMTTGNIIASIDIETGIVEEALDRCGPDIHWVDKHTDTGLPVVGFQIEQWQELKDLIVVASRALSPFRMQHWDVSMTTRGPVILEMNFIGDIEALQLFGSEGARSEKYLNFAKAERVW